MCLILLKKVTKFIFLIYFILYYFLGIYLNSDDPRKMCGCNTNFEIEAGLKTLEINLKPYKLNANKRLDELVKIFCLKCGANRQKPDINSQNKGIFDFKILKIKDSSKSVVNEDKNKDSKNQKDKNKKKENNKNKNDNNDIDNDNDNDNKENQEEKEYVSNCDHVICHSCIEDFSRSIINKHNNMKNKNQKDKSNVENVSKIYCNICEYEHSADMKPILNQMKKNPCCQNGCVIY